MDWSGFLALARQLAASPGEAELRTAVSRAYYSAYNVARSVVKRREPDYLQREEQANHKKMWDWYLNKGKAARIQNLGWGFRIKRNQADYDLGVPNLKTEAASAIAKAENILKMVAAFDTAA